MLTTGTRLGGRYEILSPLGSGGMGVVYRARDLRLDREVAVKILPDHLLEHREAMTRFEREAKALAALSHPGILAIFDFGADQGVSYAVTELLKGRTLRAFLAAQTPSWKESLPIAEAIAEALAAAHSRGVVHRDLKPENIFLTADGKVKILDFGLARLEHPPEVSPDTSFPTATATGTEMGVVLGTLPYMSPEQVRGTRQDARTDIFSFGSMLFEMLAGTRAFPGSSQADVVASVLKEDPISRRELPSDLPAGLVQTISRCLEKDPDRRFQSSKDLAFALRVSEESGKTAAVRETASRAVPAKGIRAMAIGLAVLAAIACAILFYHSIFTRKEIQSLAVLPFANGTNDPDAEYISDGLTETLISSLSQVPHLRVMAHDTVFSYKGKQLDPRKIGSELNVEAVVTGRVVQHGSSLIIYANLVKVADGSELWGDQYDKTMADIVTMQTDISREISGTLRSRLTGEEQNRVARKYTQNSDAYQLYLKGNYFFFKFTQDDFEKARIYYQKAIDIDPNFAEAWAAIADCHGALAYEGYAAPGEEVARAKAAAQKALQLNSSYGRPHLSMGGAYQLDWDLASAMREVKTAIRLEPSVGEYHRVYSESLRALGRWDEAIVEAQKAHDLDPLSFGSARTLGITYFWAAQYDKAIEQYKKALELDANRPTIHDSLADVYAKKGMYEEAIQERQRLLSLSGDDASAGQLGEDFLKYGYAVAVRRLTQAYLELYQQEAEEHYISPLAFAVLYTELNDREKALEWLEKAYQERTPWLIFLKTDPQFESLRSDPRFVRLVKRVGIPGGV